jgi:hypothetical protein
MPYLVGAATTLVTQMVIQFQVVPRVDARRRREERWERNLIDLGELLTTEVPSHSQEAQLQQSIFRGLREHQGDSQYDQERLTSGIIETREATRQATRNFVDLIRSRVDWLADRVIAHMMETPEVAEFVRVSYLYRLTVLDIGAWSPDDDRPEAEFEEIWQQEHDRRFALLKQVKILVDVRHPPRPSRLRHVRALPKRVRKRFQRSIAATRRVRAPVAGDSQHFRDR